MENQVEVKIQKDGETQIISLRGTGKFSLPDNSFEFIPQKKGKPVQKDVKRYGMAKAHTTTGSDPKRVITLQCPADCADPYSEFVGQFKNVVKEECHNELPAELTPKGSILKKTEDMTFSLNVSKKRIEVSFFVTLEPDGVRDYKVKFYDKIQELSKAFAMNEKVISKCKR